MPVPAQATLYDKKGIPIAVDPRAPGLTRITPTPIQDPLSRPDPSDLLPSEYNRVASTTTAKRNASDDLLDDLGKRVKSDHKPFVLESPATITAPPPTPVSASSIRSARATAGDFMAECVANGIILTPAETSSSRQSNPSTCPPWPLEAIETLKQVSADLLLALVRKGADDRERQLQVAVGTLRTCLDVDFIPHLAAWKADAEARACQSTTPLSAVLASLKPHLSISIPQGSVPSASSPKEPEFATLVAFGVPPSREVLRKQLAGARVTMEKQASDLKQKDDEIARTKEENKRLMARLTQKSAQPEPAKSAITTKPTTSSEMTALQRINKDHIEKLNNQKFQINNLLAQNASLKEKLKSAGGSAAGTSGTRHDEDSKGTGSRDHGERNEPTWKESWGKHSPRLGSSRRDGGASSILATPVSQQDCRSASDTSRQNGDYSSFASYGKRNPTTDDARSHWERSIPETNVGQQPSSNGVSYVSTAPRPLQVKPQYDGMSAHYTKPHYTSNNGWDDYYSKDGFGGMQADRLDLE